MFCYFSMETYSLSSTNYASTLAALSGWIEDTRPEFREMTVFVGPLPTVEEMKRLVKVRCF